MTAGGTFDREGKPPADSRRARFEIDALDIPRLNRSIDAASTLFDE